ncbi:hypothetical protein GCM10011344_20420 [Dokdonia pacifica]|uniref:Uncharacterized protein n=1 Tax=Dokdonia pacifica TaxID=1627892 RepID=A0A238VQL4_9FLAO|nr:hypothetical protein [Dokdonia pacifica]GGG19643.1 hypothetical protein GCM10011344_20420 [Dokdonia pacifica]SNR35779.1 hypothetical protein SAMN06265376_10191 [Dokdonia pacifica]
MKRFFLIAIILCFMGCEQEQSTATSTLTKYIPRKASVIVKTTDLKGLQSAIKNNDLIQAFASTRYQDFLKSTTPLLKDIRSKKETLICYTQIGNNTYDVSIITKATPNVFTPDSTKITQTKLDNTSPSITKIQAAEATFYTLEIEGVFMVSTSQLLLENTLREQEDTAIATDKDFITAYNATSNATASILMKGSEMDDVWTTLYPKTEDHPLRNAFSWSLGDLNISQNDIKVNGVTLSKDSTEQRLLIFKNTKPVANTIDQITPISAQSVTAISYDNWSTYKNNLADLRKIDPLKFEIKSEDLLRTFDEIGSIQLDAGIVIAAHSLDPTLTEEAIASQKEEETIYRQVPIYSFKEKGLFTKTYESIIKTPSVQRYCILDNFYVFAAQQELLETIIANYQNNATLINSEAYKNTKSQLSNASSLLRITNTEKIPYANLVSESDEKVFKKTAITDYPFAALQLIQDTNFMHLNAVINKNENTQKDGAITQIASTKLEKAIASTPQLVKNHRTKGVDVLLQDESNTLHLLSNSGKLLWQKELDGPILGDVQQVDLYRNGRLQLAFVTPKTFYILDRNGNEVKPFPVSFNEVITQPLAVFDYEKNRKYRFIITQGDQLQMFDKEAKIVKGFGFTNTDSEIIYPPTHIQISNKDYIVIAENSGKLHILSRTGKSRIEVKESILFGDTPIFKEKNTFATHDINGGKISINTSGKLTRVQSDNTTNTIVNTFGNTMTSLLENKLIINNKVIELEYGTYTTPEIFKVGKQLFITLTNTETSQVLCFNENGKPIENFPVYGIGPAHFDYLERNKNVGFVTQGDTNSILIYQIN